MKVAAIVPAAGKGRRINSRIEKPYIELSGKPILAHTLITLSKNKRISEVVVAVNKKRLAKLRRGIIARFKIKKVRAVSGGKERRHSVLNALKSLPADIDYVLIHDGIRPFVTNTLINSSLKTAERFGASVVAVPVKPTLKYIGKRHYIRYTPDRRRFWEAQTPQVFRRDLIERAYKAGCKKRIKATDDSMLVERLGVRPKIVPGSYSNIKITTPEDLELARILYRSLT